MLQDKVFLLLARVTCLTKHTLNANLKFPTYQHTNKSYTNQIIIIHYKFQNSKHKPSVK